MHLRRLRTLTAAAALFLLAPLQAAAADLVIFAAASLKNALDAAAADWTEATGEATVISYAASSALAKQIEEGAPADIFFSADLDWMKYLTDRKLVAEGSEIRLLGNEIVLIASADSKAETTIAKDFALATFLGDGKLAMGDVKAVPAGKYGKAALESLGVWSSVEGRVAQAENVRAALKLVATGEAPLGIVYRTDARAEPEVKVVGTFPSDSHPPIIYPVAITAGSKKPDAAALVTFLQTAKAQDIFKAQGFTILVPPATN
jgi:molybdate transport system substrate-binding protein